jgi:hypothetical protein
MNGSSVLANVAADCLTYGPSLFCFIAVIYGCFLMGKVGFEAYEVAVDIHSAPTARQVSGKAAVACVLLGFSGFISAVNSGVGGDHSATSYAALSFSGTDSASAQASTIANAGLVAVFQILQVMGVASELRGVFDWLAILEHRGNPGWLQSTGLILGGGVLVHLSLIVSMLSSITQSGLFN